MVTRRTLHHLCSSAFAAASLFYGMPAAASPTATPLNNVEFSIGLEAMHAQPLRTASDLALIPRRFNFIATYLPPASIPIGGFLTMTDDLCVRGRAASLEDAARVALPPVTTAINPSVALIGASFAGAAAAIHPTLVARAQGAVVRLDPMVWPPGVMLQGVFF